MLKKQTLINAIMSIGQVLIVGGTFFILYRLVLTTIGIEQLGIWSVVLAATSIANTADLGISGGVVKFVAKYLARGEEKIVAGVIQTSAISVGILIGLIALLIYPFAHWLLTLLIPVANLQKALSILPYALLSLWLTAISSVFRSSLDGYQRIDIRSAILITGAVIYLTFSFLLVPSFGLMGLAYAQIIQASTVLVISWAMLKRLLPLLPAIPHQWNKGLFVEMIGYGCNFQVMSISQMLYDPITKALLSRFGGLATVGFYEMANRMIVLLRSILTSANQVLVPAIADQQEKEPETIVGIYKYSYRLILYIALPLFSLIIAFAPAVSRVLIGHYEDTFVLFSILLVAGWFINTLSGPAYFVVLGIGELRWNTIGHVAIALINLGLGLLLGSIYGGVAVVIAWMLSLIIGSSINPLMYHHRHRISLRELLPKESIGIALSGIAAALISLLLYRHFLDRLTFLIVAVIILSVIVLIPTWLHPMRKDLIRWVATGLSER